MRIHHHPREPHRKMPLPPPIPRRGRLHEDDAHTPEESRSPDGDGVDEASRESFPASDAPANTGPAPKIYPE